MGVDVSHFQGNVAWAEVKAAGNAFAFAKATEGENYVDPMFTHNWNGMAAAGIVRGAYHFALVQEDAATQAQHFAGVLKTAGYTENDLPPVLDLEDSTGANAIGNTALIAWTHTWMQTIKQELGRIPILYIDDDFLTNRLDDSFAGYVYLWLARYESNSGSVDPWSSWTFWQYSDSGSVAGIAGHCDLDHFAGTQDDLAAFIAGSILTS